MLNAIGGWSSVREKLIACQTDLLQYRERRVIGLLDFDHRPDPGAKILNSIDPAIKDRLFILGTQSHPEQLKKDLGSFEAIGKGLAHDCMNGTNNTWGHPLLCHNAAEVLRMQSDIGAILFGRGESG